MFTKLVMDISSIKLANDQRRPAFCFGGISLVTASAGKHNNVVQVRFPRTRCHIWVEFFSICPYSVLTLFSKTNILKFPFDLDSVPML